MAWVEQIGKQSWRVRYTNADGKVRTVSGFVTEQQARTFAADLPGKLVRGAIPDPSTQSVTFQEWSERWLPTLRVSERTDENYRRELTNHLLPRWGECPLASITPGQVNAWAEQMLVCGYATSTVADRVKLLSRLLTDAVDAQLLHENPVHRRRSNRGPRVVHPLAERVWAAPEHVVQIAENAGRLGYPDMGLLIVTAAWTGMRWGEIAGLQRRNLHLAHGYLTVDRYVGALHESGPRLWLGPPKTSASIRLVTLPPFLIQLLREHLAATDGIPVFCGPHGGWLRRSNVDRRILRPAADGTRHLPRPKVLLDPIRPKLTFHGLRHSQKTWLIADGVPEIAQARRLGHHLEDRIVETYSHVAPEVDRRLLEGLEARWHAAQAYLHPHEPALTPVRKQAAGRRGSVA